MPFILKGRQDVLKKVLVADNNINSFQSFVSTPEQKFNKQEVFQFTQIFGHRVVGIWNGLSIRLNIQKMIKTIKDTLKLNIYD